MGTLPSSIGSFRISGVLGRGGMGVVYRAEGPGGEAVAIKTVQVADRERLGGIRREIAALARLRHPGIVRVLGHGAEEGLPWYAMELLEEETLAALLASERAKSGSTPTRILSAMPEAGGDDAALAVRDADAGRVAWALTMARRLCFPLAYLHGEGFVHRDLKPENVVVRDGWPVLVDFGLSARSGALASREELEVPGEIAGTVPYMSPEQCRGEIPDARSDLYALGCLLFELIAGRPPFLGAMGEVLWKHLRSEPPRLSLCAPGAPPAVEEIVARLLAKSPRERYGHADAVADELARAGADGAVPAAAPRPRAYLYRAGLAGRAILRREIEAWLAAAERTEPAALLLLAGESGIGKTRLALEGAGSARMAGWQVFAGQCSAPDARGKAGGLEPLRPLLLAVADRCREGGERTAADLLGIHAKVLALFEPALAAVPGAGALPDPVELPEEQARARVGAALAHLLDALTRNGKLLLVLDDLQWCDALTRDLLASAAARRLPPHVRILGTVRRDEGPSELLEEGAPGTAVRTLDRLDAPSLAALVGEMLAVEEPPAGFVHALAARSAGNPFFVCEYLRMAVAEGVLTPDPRGSWQVGEGYEELPDPGSIVDLVRRRLQGLSPAALRTVQALAVLGRRSPSALVFGLLEVDGEPEAVRELLVREVIEDEGECFRFVHDQLRAAAYDGIAEPERRRLHEEAGRALEASGGPLSGMVPLGRHWEESGDLPRARSAYLAQARQARTQHALDEAGDLLRRLLRLAPPPGQRHEARIELAMGILQARGRLREAIEVLEEEDRECAGEPRMSCRTARELAALYSRTGPMERAKHFAERALSGSRALGDAEGEAHALRLVARLRIIEGRIEEAAALQSTALGMAREASDANLEAMVLAEMANREHVARRADAARSLHAQALAIHRRLGNRRAEANVLGNLASLAWAQGHLAEARELTELALPIVREIGDRPLESFLLGGLGSILWAEEQREAAGGRWSEALAIAEQLADRSQQATLLSNLASWDGACGRRDAAIERCRRSIELARVVDDRLLEIEALTQLGQLLRDTGRVEEARASLVQALERCAGVEDPEIVKPIREALATLGTGTEGGDVSPFGGS